MASTGIPTANYDLNQWLGTDKPERLDFNSDNQKTDAALNALDASLSTFDAQYAHMMQQIERRNILHNWDFRNPVNQRGLTSYTGNIYTIDRWRLATSNLTVTVVNGGVQISATSSATPGNSLYQILENSNNYFGKTYTLSVMYDNEIFSTTVLLPSSMMAGDYGTLTTPFGTIRCAIQSSESIIAAIHVTPGTSAVIQAVKLELGEVSTLSNDPPMDYGKELAVCQRYQLRIGSSRYRASQVTSTALMFMIPVPTTMRIIPSITWNDAQIRDWITNAVQTGFVLQMFANPSSNIIAIQYNKSGHGLSDAQLFIPADSYILLDANL